MPRLWLLKRKQRTRFFQKMRVPEIVSAVLREAGISTRWQITHAYPEREYTTQYEETDYRFIKRLLAEAGIYFYFPQGPTLDGAAFAAGSVASAAAAANPATSASISGCSIAIGTSRLATSGTRDGAHSACCPYAELPCEPACPSPASTSAPCGRQASTTAAQPSTEPVASGARS